MKGEKRSILENDEPQNVFGTAQFEFHLGRIARGSADSICIPATQQMEGNEGRDASCCFTQKMARKNLAELFEHLKSF